MNETLNVANRIVGIVALVLALIHWVGGDMEQATLLYCVSISCRLSTLI